MKHLLRVPADQFAFIEQEFDGTAEEAVEAYKHLTQLVKTGPGLEIKVFNSSLDEYLTTGSLKNGTELWQEMNDSQRLVFQEIKKSKQRTK